jgi:hypothetical protein
MKNMKAMKKSGSSNAVIPDTDPESRSSQNKSIAGGPDAEKRFR